MSTNNQESPTDQPVPQQQVPNTEGPATSASGENLQCQWVGCGERCTTAELLYDHVCERHVGRKSTNNLNLTCQWGSCRTTTVKRDHITSHIRVHVPLKPHKCEFCGKAFKRPQDLKKHVKTHADDSVILRSPGPDQAGARPSNVYNNMSNGKDNSGFYNGAAMNPGAAPQYNHAPNAYYQPQPPQHASDYGTVYYGVNGGNEAGHQMNYASQKRGYDALNDLFGDLKRRQIDPSNYAAFGQRLFDLQALQLPVLQSNPVPEYQQMPAMATAGGGGSEGYHPSSMPAYSLPPMGNVRTKGDLMNLDQLLETMQATIYENPNHVAAAGIAQPGAYAVQGGAHYRTSNSPPSNQLPSSHQTATAHNNSVDSTNGGTPALTPPSSASYTSSHSPSMQSAHHISPAPQSAGGMYPSLPQGNTQDSMGSSYPTTSGAPTSTLGSGQDPDDRRRYGGGFLQRARPARHGDEMDVSDDSPTPPAKSPTTSTPARKSKRTELAASLIDPALNGLASPSTGEESADEKAQEQWVENIRLVEWLREYVKGRLERGLFDGDDENEEMKDIEHDKDIKVDPELALAQKLEPSLYPSLKGLEAEV